jgi:hypothetical protein
MATLEERMARVEHEIARVEHENAELKKAVELLNTALGALVSRATLEKVNERNDKIFDTLMRHDQFTNQQLAELREQLTEQDGKIVGLQAEMRQHFEQQDGQAVGLQIEMRQGFTEVRQDVSTQLNRLEKLLLDRLPPPQ